MRWKAPSSVEGNCPQREAVPLAHRSRGTRRPSPSSTASLRTVPPARLHHAVSRERCVWTGRAVWWTVRAQNGPKHPEQTAGAKTNGPWEPPRGPSDDAGRRRLRTATPPRGPHGGVFLTALGVGRRYDLPLRPGPATRPADAPQQHLGTPPGRPTRVSSSCGTLHSVASPLALNVGRPVAPSEAPLTSDVSRRFIAESGEDVSRLARQQSGRAGMGARCKHRAVGPAGAALGQPRAGAGRRGGRRGREPEHAAAALRRRRTRRTRRRTRARRTGGRVLARLRWQATTSHRSML